MKLRSGRNVPLWLKKTPRVSDGWDIIQCLTKVGLMLTMYSSNISFFSLIDL